MSPQVIFNALANKTQAYAPEIITGMSIAAGAGSTIFACKATLKMPEILDKLNEAKSLSNEMLGKPVPTEEDPDHIYNEQDQKVHFMVFYRDTVLDIVKEYWPAAVLGAVSISMAIGANNIHAERNANLAAAYSVVAGAFAAYRKRVAETFGDDKEKEVFTGVKKVEKTVKGENGKKQKVEEVVRTDTPLSPYARCFDESNPNWKSNATNNLTFLEAQERILNDRLKVKGMLLLNDVYDQLGMDRSQAGCAVGWVYDPKNENLENYVDFGLYRLTGDEDSDQAKFDFMEGHEKSVWLDFNVDGSVYDLMRKF